MSAKECIIKMVTECHIFDLNNSTVAETFKELQVANNVDDFVCRNHIRGICVYSFVCTVILTTVQVNKLLLSKRYVFDMLASVAAG